MYDLQLWAMVRLPPSDYGKLINELEGEGRWQWIIGLIIGHYREYSRKSAS